ncbi:rhomboid family intramembrane serine protease [Clostridium paridis]|uniref:Rhomboid family intramembrane serine protease n=1 Tax=Clostridium paridis TaxID=2803863 RepID=A0A937FJ47_9CLOT|nr:rhomboid family intramembrane serine protease [Clostridium paridis]MBL4932436.1 rhomboid family intramembrane serine protease [Clostridium paridis]
MKSFEQLLLNKLVNEFGFYIKDVNQGDLKWIAKMKVDNGEIFVGVVSKENRDITLESEEGSFIKVIEGNYNGEELKSGEIYFSPDEKQVVASWNDKTPFIDILNSLYRRPTTSTLSYITMGIIAINIFVFIYSAFLSGSVMDIKSDVLYELGAKYTQAIQAGEYWRLITSAFLHGGLVHIAVNMYSLFYTGNQVNRIYGNRNFVIIYFLSAVGASGASMLTNSLSVGASGAIFGLLGGLLVFAYKERTRIGKDFLVNLVSIIAMNLIIGFMLPNIDMYGHIGGLLTGLVLGFILYKRK